MSGGIGQVGLIAHVTWIPMWLFVTTQIVSWGLVAYWIAQEITRVVVMRFGRRAQLKTETLRAQREIHTLAVAAFAEMLDEARFGEIPAKTPQSSVTTTVATTTEP